MKTEAQVKKEFIDDLKALLKKYNAEIGAEDHWSGRDIRMMVNIPSIYKDGEIVQESAKIDLGESFSF